MIQGKCPCFLRPLKRVWNWLPNEQKQWVESVSASGAVNTVLLVVLGILTLSSEKKTEIKLVARSSANAAEAEEITLAEVIVEEPEDSMLETMEQPVELPEVSTVNFTEMSMPAEQPVTQALANSPSVAVKPMPLAGLRAEADMIIETSRRVSNAGGELEGPVRASLIFDGMDDLDLHVMYTGYVRPGQLARIPRQMLTQRRNEIHGHLWFAAKRDVFGALDVDANGNGIMAEPCENVVFQDVPLNSTFIVRVHLYSKRDRTTTTPYIVIIKCGDQTQVIKGEASMSNRLQTLCEFRFNTRFQRRS